MSKKPRAIKNMINLEKLLEEDKEGGIIISKMFDYAVNDWFGDIETDPFVVCELDAKKGVLTFSSNTEDGLTLKLEISTSGKVIFWSDEFRLHFNQYGIYEMLFKL